MDAATKSRVFEHGLDRAIYTFVVELNATRSVGDEAYWERVQRAGQEYSRAMAHLLVLPPQPTARRVTVRSA